MAEEKESEAGAAQSHEGGGGGSKIVMIFSAVNMLATIGVIAVLFLAFQKEKSKPAVEDLMNDAKSGHGEAAGGHGEKKEEGHGGGHGEKKEEGHGGGHGGGAAAGPDLTDVGKIIQLETFTVNLATSAGTHPRYVRINVSVELEQGGVDKEFDLKLPKVRDTVINLLNSKKAIELSASEGRMQLKEDIKRALNSFLVQCKVKDVYFTNFAIN